MKLKKLFSTLSSICLVIVAVAFACSYYGSAFTEDYKTLVALAYTKYYSQWALAPVAVIWGVFHWRLLKEMLRKFIIMLKRNPSLIPLAMLMVTFLYYSLNLSKVSDTTALVQGKSMGLCQFCIMLVNMLCMLCMLNAFPRRKKPNIPMLILVFVMLAVLFLCSQVYINAVYLALNRAESPIKITEKTIYVAQAYNMLANYKIMVIVTAVLTATLPLYSKLIRKIKTSIAVEDNGDMAQIEIED